MIILNDMPKIKTTVTAIKTPYHWVTERYSVSHGCVVAHESLSLDDEDSLFDDISIEALVATLGYADFQTVWVDVLSTHGYGAGLWMEATISVKGSDGKTYVAFDC